MENGVPAVIRRRFMISSPPKCRDRDSRICAGELLIIQMGKLVITTTRIRIDRMEKGVAPDPKGAPQETSGTGVTWIAVPSDEGITTAYHLGIVQQCNGHSRRAPKIERGRRMRISTALPAQQASTEGPQRYIALISADPSPPGAAPGLQSVGRKPLEACDPGQLCPHRTFRTANRPKAEQRLACSLPQPGPRCPVPAVGFLFVSSCRDGHSRHGFPLWRDRALPSWRKSGFPSLAGSRCRSCEKPWRRGCCACI